MIINFGTSFFYQTGRFAVENPGRVVIKIMRQVGRNDNNGIFVGNVRFQNPGQLVCRNIAVNQRHNLKIAQNFLQKRQLDFQAMFLPVRLIKNPNGGVGGDNFFRKLPVDGDFAEKLAAKIAKKSKQYGVQSPKILVPMEYRHLFFTLLSNYLNDITVITREEVGCSFPIEIVTNI